MVLTIERDFTCKFVSRTCSEDKNRATGKLKARRDRELEIKENLKRKHNSQNRLLPYVVFKIC